MSGQSGPPVASGGIARRLMALLLLATLLPLAGLGLAAVWINQHALELEAHSRSLSLAAAGRAVVDRHLEAVRRETAAIAQLLSSRGLAQEDLVQLVASRIASSEGVDFVTLYDVEGRRQGTLKASEVADPVTPETLAEALRPPEGGVRFGALEGEGAELALTVVSRPPAPRPIYLLTRMRLAPMAGDFATIGSRLGAPSNAFLASRSRRVLVQAPGGAPGDNVFNSVTGTMDDRSGFAVATDFTDATGEAWVGAIEALAGTPLVVVVQEPAARAFWSLRWLRVWLAVSLAVALALAIGIALLGSRSFTAPIARLMTATRELVARRFERIDPSVTARSDELGGLGRAFDAMAEGLRSSEREVARELGVRASLSRYLPAELVERVVKNPETLALGGSSREVTVLFADVVGFTRFSEQLPPETVVKLLNEHFTVATEVVHKHGGIVDKFIGDCVMAVWGAVTPAPEDAENAVLAAEEMRRWLDIGNDRWEREYGIRLQLAIGVHSGRAVAGNLGSEKRMEFTVIGDVVNVAARLESMAQPGQILVSAQTQSRIRAGTIELASLGEQQLRGRNSTTHIYEVRA